MTLTSSTQLGLTQEARTRSSELQSSPRGTHCAPSSQGHIAVLVCRGLPTPPRSIPISTTHCRALGAHTHAGSRARTTPGPAENHTEGCAPLCRLCISAPSPAHSAFASCSSAADRLLQRAAPVAKHLCKAGRCSSSGHEQHSSQMKHFTVSEAGWSRGQQLLSGFTGLTMGAVTQK